MEQLDACTHIRFGKTKKAPLPSNYDFISHSHHFDALKTGHSPAL